MSFSCSKEKKRIKKQSYYQRNRAQNLLMKQQQQLQFQRTHVQRVADPRSQGTPIIKDGRVVGYAVQVDAKAAKLPTVVVNRPSDNSFPEIDDYSLLEPEVILEELDGTVSLNLDVVQGSRKVIVNGKLLTLVPFSGDVSKQQTKRTVVIPGLRKIAPKSPIKVMSTSPPETMNVTCDQCFVKLPPRIMEMHMKIRHSKTNNNAAIADDEIQILDDTEDEPKTSTKPMPDLIELNNPDETDENQDPLADPLAL